MTILWLKTLHVFFMVAWMAGLFYLPRLFVYHAEAQDQATRDTFKVMERKLWRFVTPFAVLTLVFGLAMIWVYGREWFRASLWLHVKFVLLILLYGYHFYLLKIINTFARDENTRSHVFYRFLNEAPVLVLLGIIALAIVKPSI